MSQENIQIIKAKKLAQLNGIQHGFFTKNGGVSSGIYTSLNCSHGSHDDPDHVTENRSRAMSALGAGEASLYGLHQIHSSQVYHIRQGMSQDYRKGDGMVTNEPGIALSVLGADCAPLLLADPVNQVIAAAHSGWKGALEGVIYATIEAMIKLGAQRGHILAAIGPTIQRQSYEVKPDFVANLKKSTTVSVDKFFAENNNQIFFDLPAFINFRLNQTGVTNIETLEHDTFKDSSSFFSYRRTTHAGEQDYGRQISIITLTNIN